MKFTGLAVLALVLALAGGPARAQQPTGVVIQTETRLVLVDSVVTDKKGEYVSDLKMKDFHVWEDNKEQTIKSFSFEADPASPNNSQKRYLVLFFDNSTLDYGAQARARDAAAKFIDANGGPNRLIAIVNFGGAVQIAQNFTDNIDRLKQVVSGIQTSAVSPNQPVDATQPQLSGAAADFGARDLILALRSLAKNLRSVPGRKILVLLTAGFPLLNEQISEVTATLDVCNRSNVAIYPIDVRGLDAGVQPIAPGPRASLPGSLGWFASSFVPQARGGGGAPGGGGSPGGGAPGGGGGRGGAGGGAPVGGSSGGRGGGTAPAAPAAPGGRGNAPSPGTSGRGGPTGGGYGPGVLPPQLTPYNQSRDIIPKFPESTEVNAQIMYMLANGTGGFVIHNTNDLLGGLEKIAKEQNQFYILGYTPPETAEGSCHVLRVKVDRGGLSVRSRTGYCNAKSHDVLAGDPIEKQLETRVAAGDKGTIAASMQVPYFFTGPNVARVNLALEIASEPLKFEKIKGKFHADLNVLGVAYTADGAVSARFSDTLKLDLNDKKEVEAFKEKPLHYENQFEVASGRYNLKVVFSSGGASFGKVEMPLAIDGYDSKQFAVSSLALSKQALRASTVGAALDASLLEDKTPLIAEGDVQVIPSGSPQFRKGEPTLFYFEVYEPLLVNPDPNTPIAVAIQIRILDRKTGESKQDTGMMRLDLPKTTGNPVIRLAERVPADKLPPGAYVLETTALDTAGKAMKRIADFDLE